MNGLCVKDLHLDLDGRSVLKGVTIDLPFGHVTSVIGANGAGKTTLLRAISQDLPSHRGSVTFAGQVLSSMEARERATSIAVLSQSNTLNFAFTGFEVVALGRTPHATGVTVDEGICHEVMASLDVGHLEHRLYPSLSGGEQQRIQLARVFAQIWQAEENQARLLLLDEPVTSLDLGHQHMLMQAIRDFSSRGATVMMTVHDIGLAAAYSDQLLALHDGVCIAQGTPESVLTASLIKRLFDIDVSVIAHPTTGKPIVIGGDLCN